MNKKILILTFGILLLSLTFVSASENKIWYGRNESNPSQMIPVLLNNLGKPKIDLNLVNITAGSLELNNTKIFDWRDLIEVIPIIWESIGGFAQLITSEPLRLYDDIVLNDSSVGIRDFNNNTRAYIDENNTWWVEVK